MGVIIHVWQSLLKERVSDSLGVLTEDIMQELLTGVTFFRIITILVYQFFYSCSFLLL